MKQKLKVFFLSHNLSEMARQQMDKEFKVVDQALRQGGTDDSFELEQYSGDNYDELITCFQKYKPDIVHFTGIYSDTDKNEMEENSAEKRLISESEFSQLLLALKDQVNCIMLNNGFSQEQAQTIFEYVNCVVRIPQSIGEDAANQFVLAFYRTLGHTRDMQVAFDASQAQLKWNRINKQDLPQLFLRNQKIYKSTMRKSTSSPKRKPWRERWLFWLTLVATIFSLVIALLDLPLKFAELFKKQVIERPVISSNLRGVVIDISDGKVVENVLIEIRELPRDTIISTYTTSDGSFNFNRLPVQIGERLRLYYSKPDYKSGNEYITVPGPVKIILEKVK